MICARFLVSGHVQGVFFRASTRDVLARLELGGHAENQPDGSVEVVACGDAMALDVLQQWLEVGPPAARVDSVKRTNLETAPPKENKTVSG